MLLWLVLKACQRNDESVTIKALCEMLKFENNDAMDRVNYVTEKRVYK